MQDRWIYVIHPNPINSQRIYPKNRFFVVILCGYAAQNNNE
jgi:hypothetical protein